MTDSNIPAENSKEKGNKQDFLVVGIGASAGGINALREFFENVSPHTGIAYVVILHLSPDYDSKLANVLQATTKIPVSKVEGKTNIKPDHVYVIPPDKSLSMVDGHIEVNPINTIEERRAPVDIFFRTLAQSHGSRAVAVILSGTGANGSMGLKRIKENGGVAFVQNPRQAEYNEMPRNAIATDLVDAVLPVCDIPSKIIAYKERLGSVHIPSEAAIPPEDHQQALRDIFTQLRLRTGHDFTNYKRATVLRRIERRINVNNLPDLPSYANFLREVQDESQALLKDLLISVTNFFRDKYAFAYIENEIIPNILKGKTAEDKIRVWVTGCATGEEAYSMAILFAERTLNVLDAPAVQIFATDIDDDALAQAREAVYSLNDAADVSPDRLRRFFSKEEYGYRVRREIREMILFANHNVIKDPPFSRLHLVSCRNMLIYLNQSAQTRVMEILHFALNPGGYLLIGSSESVDGASDLYVPVSKEHHVYQSRPVVARTIPVPDLPSFRFDPPHQVLQENLQEKRMLERITYNELHQQLLEKYAPPSVVINQDFDLVHLSEKAGRYLQMSGGEPSRNILKLVKQELRLELRSGLYQAVQRKVNIDLKNLKVKIDDTTEAINIVIRPVLHHTDATRGYILVIFEKVEERSQESTESMVKPDAVAAQLEEELIRSKAQLRGSIEQYEVQAEELKASNEELQAMNEELRSSAEELETSREELQSINEELTTVNQELKVKIDELSHSNNNFQNLINSTDIGTIFLDRSFRVNLFTPAARQIFNLIPNDIGRPLSDISNRLTDVDVLADAETVIENLQTIEREVRTNDKCVYVMRVLPYRTAEDRINGFVVTFINITERKNAELELRQSEANLRMLMDSISDYSIITFNTDLTVSGWNKEAQMMFGYSNEEIIGKSINILYTPEDIESGEFESEIKKLHDTGKADEERWQMRKDGSRFFASGIVNKMKEGKRGYVKIARDMTASKLIEQQKDEFIGVASHELKTPVTSIKGYVEVLQEMLNESSDKKTFELIKKLNVQVDRLATLITDLLDTTKLSAGQLIFSKEEIDVNALIEECKENLQRISANHTIHLNLQKVPRLKGDRERIQQVLTNLILNAVKYSPKGGDVTVSSLSKNHSLIIAVEDEGIGIPDESQKMLFQRFYRSANPMISTFPGLGLGLYIAAEIVKRHNGNIKVESQEGKGSRFIVTLPLDGQSDN
jgi:two-component system, chemotaxis family, CheB/CheR fusion protein